MYRCCIFDLDGTLLNTLNALSYCSNAALRKYGLGEIPTEEFKWMVGDGYRNQMRRALIYLGDKELVHWEEACKDYMEIFREHSMYGVQPYDGILETIRQLKEMEIKLAVLSNKPNGQAINNIEEIFGKEYFDFIAGQIDGVPKKPDPSGALRIAKQFGVRPEECLYIGDTNTDMKTGIGAGMKTIGVTWGFREREELEAFSPVTIIDHPQQIVDLIQTQ
ncbi:MAG: HAD family hydrolase [Lachnospiraceae bacterium]|nr:HAD family hydrolase [Lachnospiraceae bacterium]